jgi:hypothetical protein
VVAFNVNRASRADARKVITPPLFQPLILEVDPSVLKTRHRGFPPCALDEVMFPAVLGLPHITASPRPAPQKLSDPDNSEMVYIPQSVEYPPPEADIKSSSKVRIKFCPPLSIDTCIWNGAQVPVG